jgi:hypothetical protein
VARSVEVGPNNLDHQEREGRERRNVPRPIRRALEDPEEGEGHDFGGDHAADPRPAPAVLWDEMAPLRSARAPMGRLSPTNHPRTSFFERSPRRRRATDRKASNRGKEREDPSASGRGLGCSGPWFLAALHGEIGSADCDGPDDCHDEPESVVGRLDPQEPAGDAPP